MCSVLRLFVELSLCSLELITFVFIKRCIFERFSPVSVPFIYRDSVRMPRYFVAVSARQENPDLLDRPAGYLNFLFVCLFFSLDFSFPCKEEKKNQFRDSKHKDCA